MKTSDIQYFVKSVIIIEYVIKNLNYINLKIG